jgi:hypothetical protein
VGKVVLPQGIAIPYAAHESRLTTIRVNRAPPNKAVYRTIQQRPFAPLLLQWFDGQW